TSAVRRRIKYCRRCWCWAAITKEATPAQREAYLLIRNFCRTSQDKILPALLVLGRYYQRGDSGAA
ncbi:hypothetical protein VS877_22655, partial [Salmonella enterica subsp. enterica serovar Paratyphi A]|nr:hypothetical protein [Salmonella enterica subsp. enterica serovar Paratyphi A]